MSKLNRGRFALLTLTLVMVAQPALAQSVTCDQLKQLQQLGKDRFVEIDGGVDEFGTRSATMLLDGAEDCYLDFSDTTYATYTCTWRGFPDLQSAETGRLALKNQVLACLPTGFKLRERTYDNKIASGFSTSFDFDSLQPNIRVDRSFDKKYRRHSVRFTFQVDLYE